ncbi:RES family NAD+ phosphorylase [Chthonobacter albigriseus]|uniref:RES family NAD+ phosphorylase n=1 Tax=Chthonobacter albigriseus TaxID=1683161 RepID=UPI0015EE6921|nr:RES family NAD+ phosphorylase [Chthonobacter albigriseus]
MGLQPEDLILLVWRYSNYTDLSGRGGLVSAGRWHTRGTPIVYTADEPQTAFDEVKRRLSNAEFVVPDGYKLLEIRVPRTVSREEVEVSVLPSDWAGPGPRTWQYSQPIGDAWLTSGRSAMLKVPSAARIGAFNFLINPVHRHSDAITVLRIHDPADGSLFT